MSVNGNLPKAFQHSQSDPGWVTINYGFTANTLISTIKIGSTTQGGHCGPVIDTVSVVLLVNPPAPCGMTIDHPCQCYPSLLQDTNCFTCFNCQVNFPFCSMKGMDQKYRLMDTLPQVLHRTCTI